MSLRIGKRYDHPDDGPIEITEGAFLIGGRVSNFWYWKIIDTGKKGHGYGGPWPELYPDRQLHDLADQLNEAWTLIRTIPGGYEDIADACLEAARLIRPVT